MAGAVDHAVADDSLAVDGEGRGCVGGGDLGVACGACGGGEFDGHGGGDKGGTIDLRGLYVSGVLLFLRGWLMESWRLDQGYGKDSIVGGKRMELTVPDVG